MQNIIVIGIVIGNPCCRRRETKPISVPDSNFYRGVHVVPMTLDTMKAK